MLDTYTKPRRAARVPKDAVQGAYKAPKAFYNDTDSNNDLSDEDQMPKPAGVCCCCCRLTATRASSMRHSNPGHEHPFRQELYLCACAGHLSQLGPSCAILCGVQERPPLAPGKASMRTNSKAASRQQQAEHAQGDMQTHNRNSLTSS
jgi:hypothetical protein